MRPLVFDEKLKFGIAVIDRQHRRMVAIVNALVESVIDHEATQAETLLLDELVRLAELNFRTEEEWMRRYEFAGLDVHAESHVHLLQQLVDLRDGLFTRHEQLNRKVVIFLRRWLENHLLHSDRELAEAIRPLLDARRASRGKTGDRNTP